MLDEELLLHLRQFLPEHMVPSAIVVLDELPQTPNHKVDVKALPPPGTATSRPAPAGEPADELERDLATHWAGLLRRDQIGVHDHFFRAGGNSLLVMRVLAHVRTVHGVRVPARHIFKHPTVAALAGFVRDAQRSGDGPADGADGGAGRVAVAKA